LRVLVVEDDAGIRTLLAKTFASEGWEVVTTPGGRDALGFVQMSDRLDAVILGLPLVGERPLVAELQSRSLRSALVVISAEGAADAKRALGADAAFSKPFDPLMLASEVRRLVPVAG
jgi:DNA-binding response OmpR family regulator